MSDKEYIRKYLEKTAEVANKLLREQSDKIEKIIQTLHEAWKGKRWVFTFGNGGSAANASHLAADLVKTVNDHLHGQGFKSLALVDNVSLVSALVNDWGWQNVYEAQLRTYASSGDVVIAMSVHGGSGSDKAGAWSQNILRGLQYAKNLGCTTIGLSGFEGGPMKNLVDISLVVPAESTPQVESFHYLLNHLIVFRLKELIEEYWSLRGGMPS